jgi:hypothetical protein
VLAFIYKCLLIDFWSLGLKSINEISGVEEFTLYNLVTASMKTDSSIPSSILSNSSKKGCKILTVARGRPVMLIASAVIKLSQSLSSSLKICLKTLNLFSFTIEIDLLVRLLYGIAV